MSEWRDVTLAEISERVDYGYTASASDDPALPRFLRITDIAQPHLDWSGVPGCPIDEKNLSRYELANDDIVVARTGATVGYAKRIRVHPQSVFASYLVRFRLEPDVAPSFVGAIVESNDYKQWVQQNAGGAAQPNASAKVLGAFPLQLPDNETQVRIGAIFDSIADLIENNRRRVEVLEEMARAIYREWFVKFRYPGHEHVPMVDSALGPIPEGWQISTLSSVADITTGQSPKSEFYNGEGVGQPFHQGVADFGPHFPRTRKWCSVQGREASDGDVLISVRAPVGRINIADTDITIGRGLAAVRAKDGRQGLILGYLREVFAEEDSMGNDGAIFKSLSKAELSSITLRMPSDDVADAANRILSDNLAMIRVLSQATRGLSDLRDALLPKLVTGQIDVSTLDLDALLAERVA